MAQKVKPQQADKQAADAHARRAFAAAFILKCAAAGVTDPARVAALAEGLIKRADGLGGALDAVGRTAGGLAVTAGIGSVGLPLALGGMGGALAGAIHNQADKRDLDTLRLQAQAAAYQRQAAAAAAHARVRQLVATDPSKYVAVG